MIRRFRQMFAPVDTAPPPSAAVPAGDRVYAVGDIHGRLDLFEGMIAAIEADDARRGPARTTVILLGDLVDRGPDSAGVIEAARAWSCRRNVRVLAGNHEDTAAKQDANRVRRNPRDINRHLQDIVCFPDVDRRVALTRECSPLAGQRTGDVVEQLADVVGKFGGF